MATTEESLDQSVSLEERIEQLRARKEETLAPAGDEAVKKQHERGKLTARERIDLLLDKDSFTEVDSLVRHRSYDFGMDAKRPVGDGVVTGFGTIDGRKV